MDGTPTLRFLSGEDNSVFAPKVQENAKNIVEGTGTGLHFAKLVCDLHGIDVSTP